MNTKNRKIILILIAAVLTAIAGSICLYHYLVPQKTTIYVFKENVKAGDVINEKMLIPVQADSTIFVAGANTNASERFVTGDNIDAVLKSRDSLRMDVTAGTPLTLALLTTTGGSSVEMNMNPEKIAITIPVSSVTGITNELKNGSRVNVYVTGTFDDTYSTMLLFENMRILNVNKSNESLSSVTLETSIEESLKLIYYTTSGSIYLGLIDSSGYEYSNINMPSYSRSNTDSYYYGESMENMPETDTTENTTENVTDETEKTTGKKVGKQGSSTKGE